MFEAFRSPNTQLVWRVFFLAVAYVVAGRLSLLLAIPPGFATAIFPPIGIALASVLLWGDGLLVAVLIGSTLLNTSIAVSGGAPIDLATLSVAVEIALGSCVAAWTGASLIRRYIGFPNALTDEWSIFSFFILGGPIACALSATVGVSALCANGIVPLSNYFYSWITWWTGDTIGVLIAAPIVLILYAKPRNLWVGRVSNVGLPLLLSSLLIVVIFFRSSQAEQQKIQKSFQLDAQQIASIIFNSFENHLNVLTPLKSLFLTSDQITAESFRTFTNALLKNDVGITALSWNQVVNNSDRPEFEKKIQTQGFSEFSFKELNSQQQIVKAGQRDHYVVVTYIEPFSKNNKMYGYDVASNQIRNQALELANQKTLAVMTEPLSIAQNDTQFNYLLFMPVYKTAEPPKTQEVRNQLLRGYVAASLNVNAIAEKVKQQFPPEQYVVLLRDVTDEANPVNLYQSGENKSAAYINDLTVEVKKLIGERKIQVIVQPTAIYLDANRGLQSWYVLAGGLLFCSLLGGFLLLVSGRSQYIASLVDQRTLELESILHESVEAIIILDHYGLIERVNPAACRLFGYLSHELLGLSAVNVIPLLQDLSELKSTGAIDIKSNYVWMSREALGVCKNQQTVPIEIGVSRVVLPDRFIYTCIVRDISARKKIDRLKNEFISTVSHELRTPLTSITGALGVLVGGAVEGIPGKAMDLIVIAKNNTERLGRLVNDLLDIDKLEFGELQLNLKEVELNQLMNEAISQNHSYAIKYGVHLALDNQAVADKKIILKIDPDRFLQVMSNLISNAVKFSNLEGIVTIAARIEKDTINISVEDRGAGIPDEFRSRIFQKFAQADSSDTRQRDGTGLGLSISRVIAERMGGKIYYTTELKKGSIFYFSLPIARFS